MTQSSETVVIGNPEASIALGHPEGAADGSGTRIPMQIVARGIDIQTAVDIEEWSGGVRSLIDYFDDLAAGWRGWSESKEWSDDGPGISMSATHDGVGLVKLDVTAESHSGWDGEGSWIVTVRVPVEPGALSAVATHVRALLGSHDSKSPEE